MISELTKQRWGRFRSIRRAYLSLLVLSGAFVLSLGSELIANDRPYFLYYKDTAHFPLFTFYSGRAFDQNFDEEADYRALRRDADFRENSFWLSTPIPHSPNSTNLEIEGSPPYGPNLSEGHWLGTDRLGRDLLARLLYGFRLCMIFALTLVAISTILGVVIGGVQGYLGGKTDIVMQRIIEIWSALPFLYVVILIGSIYGRNFGVLIFVMSIFSWIGLSYYMRGEFLKMRDQTYVRVARALGMSTTRIFYKQILPNALTPVITLLPFSLIGGISSLTALDFLGFGMPPPTPSWGELLQQGLDVVREHPRIILMTTTALFITLQLATFIGEGVREVFDPRSRQRVE